MNCRWKKVLCKNLASEHVIKVIREIYKPVKIDVLFIAESPPLGGVFFYCERGNLYDATKEAFKAVFDMSCYDFLDFFKEINCYLYDLFDKPGMSVRKASSEEIQKAVVDLNNFIAQEQPEAVIFVLKRVYEKVKEIKGQNLESHLRELGVKKVRVLRFPKPDLRKEYVENLKEILKEFIEQKIIRVPRYRLRI